MFPSPATVAFALLMTGWVAFTAAFVFRVRPVRQQEARRDSAATPRLIASITRIDWKNYCIASETLRLCCLRRRG